MVNITKLSKWKELKRLPILLLAFFMLVSCSESSPNPLCVDSGDLGGQQTRNIYLDAANDKWEDTGLSVTKDGQFSISIEGNISLCGAATTCKWKNGEYAEFIISDTEPLSSASGFDLTPCSIANASAPDYTTTVCQLVDAQVVGTQVTGGRGGYASPAAPASGKLWMRIVDPPAPNGDQIYTAYRAEETIGTDKLVTVKQPVDTNKSQDECDGIVPVPGVMVSAECNVANQTKAQCDSWGWITIGETKLSSCMIENTTEQACNALATTTPPVTAAFDGTSTCIITGGTQAACSGDYAAGTAANAYTCYKSNATAAAECTANSGVFSEAGCLLTTTECQALQGTPNTNGTCTLTTTTTTAAECTAKSGVFSEAGCLVETPQQLSASDCILLPGTPNSDGTCTTTITTITPASGSNYGHYSVVLTATAGRENAIISTIMNSVVGPVRELLLGTPAVLNLPVTSSRTTVSACTGASGVVAGITCSGLNSADCVALGGTFDIASSVCTGATGCGSTGALISVQCTRSNSALQSECDASFGTIKSSTCTGLGAPQCAAAGGVLSANGECTGANSCSGGTTAEIQCMLPSMGLTQKIYTNITTNTNFVGGVRALLVLAIVLFAFSYMAGLSQVTHKELIHFILKLSIIVVLIGDNSWQFFYKYLFSLFVDGTDSLIWIMSNNINDMISGADHPMMGDGGATGASQSSAIFNFLGSSLSIVLSSEANIKISSLLGAFPVGIFLMIVIYISIGTFLFAVARALLMYLTSIIMIALLLFLAPIFICFLLFKKTEQMFTKWLKQLAVFSLQPVLLFMLLAVFNILIVMSLYNLLDFTACYSCVWRINLPISEYLSAGTGFISGGHIKFPNFDEFCLLPGYLPWGNDSSQDVATQASSIPVMFMYTIIFAIFANMMLKFIDWVDAIAAQLVGKEGGAVNMATPGTAADTALNQAKQALVGNQAKMMDPKTWGGIAGMTKDTAQWADRATGNIASDGMKRVARKLPGAFMRGNKDDVLGGEQAAYKKLFMTSREKEGYEKKKKEFNSLSKVRQKEIIEANKSRREELDETPSALRDKMRKQDRKAQADELSDLVSSKGQDASNEWFNSIKNRNRRALGHEEVVDAEKKAYDKSPAEKYQEIDERQSKLDDNYKWYKPDAYVDWKNDRNEINEAAKERREERKKRNRENDKWDADH